MTDLQLSLGKQSVEPFDYNKIEIRRGKIVTDDIEEAADKAYFKRYENTEDGISPRVLPGTLNGIHHVTGVEHDETGKPSEATGNRQVQMDKRFRKLAALKFDNPVYVNAPHEEADILLVGFNSTRGAIEEVQERLNAQGMQVNHAHIRLVHPFPSTEVAPLVAKAKKVIVVENNYTGQLANIMKMNVGGHDKIETITKYNGTPFLPGELENRVKELAR